MSYYTEYPMKPSNYRIYRQMIIIIEQTSPKAGAEWTTPVPLSPVT